MAKLTARERNGLRSSTFGLPEKRAYPMPDKSHARFAKAMAAKHASPEEKKRIDAKANRILGHKGVENGLRRG
jgi:hypothetical protein